MDCSTPQHRVGTGTANVRTRGEERDVSWVGVVFAFTEAVIGGFETNALALAAILDARIHSLRTVFRCVVSHG